MTTSLFNNQKESKMFLGGLDPKTTNSKYTILLCIVTLIKYFSIFGEVIYAKTMTSKLNSKRIL